MRFLRNRFIGRFISVLLLLIFVQSIFMPYYSFALTSGAHQPEYTSYESPGSTDMVNLLTGDFTYNLPLLDVPGPEGNFSLPLSYHAGIGLEQESSWAGLGFNINAGSLVRNVNQYPDDASGEANYVAVQNLTGITGWNRTFNHPFKDDWNSQTGYHGNINLLDMVEVNFGNKTDVGIAGVHVGDNGATFNAYQFTSTVINLASYGVGSGVESVASVLNQAAINMAVNSAVSFAMPVSTPGAPRGGDWKYSKKTTGTSYKQHFLGEAIAFGVTGHTIPIFSKKKSWKIWLDDSRTENMYGTLYLGNAKRVCSYSYSATGSSSLTINGTGKGLTIFDGPRENFDTGGGILVVDPNTCPAPSEATIGTTTDINFTIDDNLQYFQQSSPTVLATDSYTVNAPGISGSITPYRLDVGSVCVPRRMTSMHERFAPVPYLNNYKVPFIYEGSISNQYINNVGGSVLPTIPNYYYGLDGSIQHVSGSFSNHDGTKTTYNMFFAGLNFSDATFDQRVQPEFDAIKRVPQGNNIEWYSNAEIISSLTSSNLTCPNKFMDFLSGQNYKDSDRFKFRSNYRVGNPLASSYTTNTFNFNYQVPVTSSDVLACWQVGDYISFSLNDVNASTTNNFTAQITAKDNSSITVSNPSSLGPYVNRSVQITLPYYTAQLQNAIGGYSITSIDGTTYHFALPIYEYNNQSESILIADNNKKSSTTRNVPFASTWLLTSITGSDFVDRNNNGIVDDGDWGYWVKMNYGKQSDSYDWRIPYSDGLPDKNYVYKSHEQGVRELYYLNSIETRSHVALFMKSSRDDGKSASGAVVPLQLDEICLLQKEQYKKLLSSPYNIGDFSNKIDKICTSSQFAASTVRDYINKNCLRRIVFGYDYSLCKNTPNAGGTNNSQKGKLTLKTISVKGRNDFKSTPDYKFEYASNPDYNSNFWDGWGLYSPSGTSGGSSHKTIDPLGVNGASWSLSKITTPLGTDVLINYERDDYRSISGQDLNFSFSNYCSSCYAYNGLTTISVVNDDNYFQAGDKVDITNGNASYVCPSSGVVANDPFSCSGCVIQTANTTSITLANAIARNSNCSASQGYPITFSGSIKKTYPIKKGGDIRVGSLVIRDDFTKQNKIRYLYSNDDGSSSGVVSVEPEYVRNIDYPFYSYLRYPTTPVMYGKVSVLSGRLSTDQEFSSKQIFEFETPDKSQLTVDAIDEGSGSDSFKKLYKIENRTSKMGRPKAISTYNTSNSLVSSSQFIYTDVIANNDNKNFQGVYSEGTVLVDGNYVDSPILNMNRTTVLSYPYVLKKITNSKDGLTSTTENLKWDLLTGAVTESLSKSSLGIYTKSIIKPAYKIYSELGSKAYNTTTPLVDNKNMLSQVAESYVYRTDPAGNALGLISANVQTWKNDWTHYRYYAGNSTKPYDDEGTQANKIWRTGPSYEFVGNYARRQADGTQNLMAANEDFDFTGTTGNTLWQYLGEINRFDHYGMPLETQDMNGNDPVKAIYSTVKMGYDSRAVIASATNAKFNEIAFSSAEDKISGIQYFGGEVGIGSTSIGLVSTPVHTGYTAISVPASTHGFFFKTVEASTTKSYRVSVWSTNPSAQIYYILNNGTTDILPSSIAVSQAVAVPNQGNWYRIDATISPSSNVLEVGVKAPAGSTAVFDDFRFQPSNAVMKCFVYPPLDYEYTISAPTYSPSYTYTLDNDNLFTKYETNEKGEVIKVYQESITNGVKTISESKSNYKRFITNP